MAVIAVISAVEQSFHLSDLNAHIEHQRRNDQRNDYPYQEEPVKVHMAATTTTATATSATAALAI
jgi:hypothetical protein